MTENDAATPRPVGLRPALAAAIGRATGAGRVSVALAGATCLGVVPLATVDSAVASTGVTVLSVGMFVVFLAIVLFSVVSLVTAHPGEDDGPSAFDEHHTLVRHGVVVLWALAALLYAVEAVSALATVVLESPGALEPARRFFLWHVADTVPVFTVTDTFDLDRPTLPLRGAGVLALVLKVALILPLIRLAIATFRVFDGSGGTTDRAAFRLFGPKRARTSPDFPYWGSALWAGGVIVGVGLLLGLSLTVCNWVGPLSARLASTLPGAPGRWTRVAGDVALQALSSLAVQAGILTLLSVVLVVATWSILRGLLRADLEVPSRFAVGLAVLVASLMSLVLVFSTAAAVDLLATCFVEQRPPMIEAAGRLEWFAWHSLDVVPEWSVPGVLDWREPTGPGSWWSGVLLMLAKLVAVLVIAVPVARVGRAARRTWPSWLVETAGRS